MTRKYDEGGAYTRRPREKKTSEKMRPKGPGRRSAPKNAPRPKGGARSR